MIHRLAPRLALLLLVGCSSSAPVPDAPEATHPAMQRADEADGYRDYLDVEDGADLGRLLDRDLQAGRGDHALEGLRRLVMASLLNGEETSAYLAVEAAKPALRFQAYGGLHLVHAVKPFAGMLRAGADEELGRLYDAIRAGDAAAIAGLGAPRRLLHPAVVARSTELQPHALLADGYLRFRALRDAARPGLDEALAIVGAMDGAAPALSDRGLDEAAFVAHVVAAQSLELVDLREAALERWIAIGELRYLPHANESVRLAVAGKIQGYRDRLRAEMTARIRDEERALAAAEVARLEQEHAKLSAEQQARVDALEGELASVRTVMRAEADADLAREREWFEGRLEDQIRYAGELQQALLDVALRGPTLGGGAGATIAGWLDGIGAFSDVLAVYERATSKG